MLTMDASTSYSDNPSHFGHLVMENEKLHRKLHKTQQRRDHYAKLYYRTLSELDETKWELSVAKEKIRELKSLVTEHSPATDTNVRRPRPNTKSGSITTSPDSGASLSPGIEPVGHYPQQKTVLDSTQFKHQDKTAFDQTDFVQSDAWSTTTATDQMVLKQPPPRQPRQPPREQHQPEVRNKKTSQPAFPPPPPPRRFERSYSLSQGDHALHRPPYHHSGGGVSGGGSLSQDVSVTRPPFERTMSMPQRMRRPRLPSSGSQTDNGQDSSTVQNRASAFKCPVPHKFSLPLSTKPHLYYDSDLSSPSTLSRLSMSTVSGAIDSLSNEAHYDALFGVQMLGLLAKISSPDCSLTKLEISNSKMGQPEVMKPFCKHLVKNNSIVELSLPSNNIGYEGLSILLDTIEHCSTIKELMLRNNVIGKECANVIKQFLSRTTLDSLVLTGNEIEQHGHLLNGGLPHDFAMEYDLVESSEDSGLAQQTESDCTSQHSLSMHNFKYFNI